MTDLAELLVWLARQQRPKIQETSKGSTSAFKFDGQSIDPPIEALVIAAVVVDPAFTEQPTTHGDKKIPAGTNPADVVVGPGGQYAYVTNEGAKTISVIDVQKQAVVKTITIPGRGTPIRGIHSAEHKVRLREPRPA